MQCARSGGSVNPAGRVQRQCVLKLVALKAQFVQVEAKFVATVLQHSLLK
jgi:hypothetical protein